MTARALLAGAALSGCMTIEGPCQFDVERQAERSRAAVQCEAGGAASIVAPGAALEAAGRAAERAHAASAVPGNP